MERNNYPIKVDDILLYLLNEYHGVDASEAMAFFTDRISEMAECPANITENSRPATIRIGTDNRTTQVSGRYGRKPDVSGGPDDPKFYVLRGFYPDSNIPFKIVATYGNTRFPSGGPKQVLNAKIIMGMKPHFSTLSSTPVDKYKEHVSEAILLDQPVMESQKIDYKYRTYKCMRPKGMELYRERNYEEKKREAARKRREAKND